MDLDSRQKQQIIWVFVAPCSTQSVTLPLVLARIRQDVSAGKCVAGMIRLHTSCSSKVMSATASIANLLHRARMPWLVEHTCDMGRAENRESFGTALGRPGLWQIFFWISMQKANFDSGWMCGQQGFAPYCTKVCWDWWALQYDWPQTRSSKRLPRHAQSFHLHVTTLTLSVYLSRLPWLSPRTRAVSREHPLRGM